MNKDFGKLITAFIALLFGIFAIIQLVPNVHLAISFLSLTFGVLAVIWTVRARSSLSKGTSLHEYASYFLFSLMLIIAFSIWDTIIDLFDLNAPSALYFKYILITLTYLVFVFTSYKILYLGRQFGFKPQVARMNFNTVKSKRKKR